MKSKKLNSKKFVFRRILALIIIACIVTFFVKFIKGKNFNSYKTIFPTLTTYENDIDTTFYNILNEKVYRASSSGIAVFNASEGQKVPVGYQICSINLMEDISNLRDELLKVEAAISYLNSQGKETENLSFNKDIQRYIINRNFEGANEAINSMDLDSKGSFSINDLKEYLSMPIDDLQNKKLSLESEIGKYNITYNAQFTGIVSYEIDGLEDYFSDPNLANYTYKYVEEAKRPKKNNINLNVKADEAIFKLIDNFSYKLVALVPKEAQIKNYQTGDRISIEINNLDILTGEILKINRFEGKAAIVIGLNDSIQDIYNKRIHEGKIIVEKTRGYIVPKSCLIERNNLLGLYIQEIKGLVKFVPVDIIKEEDEKVFISRGTRQSLIEINNKSYKTLTVNDAIVLNPRTVDESRILN